MEKLFNVFSIAYVTCCMHTGTATVPAHFQVSIGILSKSSVWKSEQVACPSRMHPHTTYWEYKCASVDTAAYTDAWGLKYKRGEKNTEYGRENMLSWTYL